jgi:hypothetical protein
MGGQRARGLPGLPRRMGSQLRGAQALKALVQADVQIVNDIVTLYRALGGGWEESVGQLAPPDVSTAPPAMPGALDRVGAIGGVPRSDP